LLNPDLDIRNANFTVTLNAENLMPLSASSLDRTVSIIGGKRGRRRREKGKEAQTLSTHGTALLRSFLIDPILNAMLLVFA